MENREYYLCSKSVVNLLLPKEVSKSFVSGYKNIDFFTNNLFYVALLNFKEVEEFYKQNIESHDNKDIIDFWLEECVSGQMDVGKITLANINRIGLFLEIENKIGLTTNYNRAMTITNLTNKYNCKNPIEFVNKIKYR